MHRRVLGWLLAALILVGGVSPVVAAGNPDKGQGSKTTFVKKDGKKSGKKGKKRGKRRGKKGKKRGGKGKKTTAAASA